ncbi:GHKL domain-containing protein [Dehalobacter sp. DCM]|uniref:sensor histidine kinase n=1 Tax=Dehalobacter sp. DCM TaxID=2907827 RepID=UPI003081A1F4|nr:GHKL domain-containing protein [Dehalobacter sp. DCM]
MKINIYKAAVIIFVTQALINVILQNNNYMKSYAILQPVYVEWLELILGLVIVLLNLAGVVIIRTLYRKGLEEEKLRSAELKYAGIIEKNQIYRQHHHDLRNHLTVIDGFVHLGKYTELREYLDSYIDSIDDVLLKVNTGVDEVDILLSTKIQEAKQKNVEITLQLNTKITCSKRNIVNLIAIIGNLLNNAIEAVQELDPDLKRVEIIFNADPLEYIFEFTNPLSANEMIPYRNLGAEGFSTKGEDRGQGLTIVRKLAERMKGSIDIDTAGQQFRITIAIPKHHLEAE